MNIKPTQATLGTSLELLSEHLFDICTYPADPWNKSNFLLPGKQTKQHKNDIVVYILAQDLHLHKANHTIKIPLLFKLSVLFENLLDTFNCFMEAGKYCIALHRNIMYPLTKIIF